MTPQELEAVLPTGNHDATLLSYGGKSVPLHLLLPALLDLWRAAEHWQDAPAVNGREVNMAAERGIMRALDRLREVKA